MEQLSNSRDIIRKPGSLEKFGYSLKNDSKDRARALRKAAKFYGIPLVKKKLNGLRFLFSKNRQYTPRIKKDINTVNRFRNVKGSRKGGE
ncbi:MAG: hypothetical protein J9259_07545 [Thermoplasmata archaeon YP2-bin.285]|uniref:Uncharacterized protein n=1 Tax=Candidatus Sysuiplasma superficiale TaxID=2823368 RepID=A0A8J7YQA0_9ARCH|nr:hypothetical protein [Candidatus Sysuiplasma superficiale]